MIKTNNTDHFFGIVGISGKYYGESDQQTVNIPDNRPNPKDIKDNLLFTQEEPFSTALNQLIVVLVLLFVHGNAFLRKEEVDKSLEIGWRCTRNGQHKNIFFMIDILLLSNALLWVFPASKADLVQDNMLKLGLPGALKIFLTGVNIKPACFLRSGSNRNQMLEPLPLVKVVLAEDFLGETDELLVFQHFILEFAGVGDADVKVGAPVLGIDEEEAVQSKKIALEMTKYQMTSINIIYPLKDEFHRFFGLE